MVVALTIEMVVNRTQIATKTCRFIIYLQKNAVFLSFIINIYRHIKQQPKVQNLPPVGIKINFYGFSFQKIISRGANATGSAG
jgi:hypothetical protein